MTGIYVVNIGNASAKQWVQFNYEHTLNGLSTAQIALDGVTTPYDSEFDVGETIKIYKSGTLKFEGEVIDKRNLTGGGVILTAWGREIDLIDEKAPMVGTATTRVWTSTSDNTIIDTLVTAASGWTTDVTNSTGTNVDFRTSASESIWNAIIRLISQTGKDIRVDQANKKIYLYDELTRDDQFSFIDGRNAVNISRKKSRSRAGKVIVYGKGDGNNQIIGSNGTGTPVHTIIDRNVVSQTEADARALAEYNKLNPQSLEYSFIPTTNVDGLRVGDSGQLSNNSAGINEEVDITRIKILVDGNGTEKITMQVSNPAYRIASKNATEGRVRELAQLDQAQTSMQGSGNLNTWGAGINAKNGAPLKIGFYISNDHLFDEAGNRRINSFTLSYDVDPFNQQYGTASFIGSDPQVQNSSGSTQPDVENDSGSTGPNVSGTTASSGVATYDTSLSGGSASTGTGTLTDSAWTTITNTANITFNSDMVFYFATFKNANAVSTRVINVRLYINGTYFPNSAGTWTEVDAGDYVTIPILAPVDINGDDVFVQAQTDSGDMDYEVTWNYQLIGKHTHADGSLAADSHTHTDGTYNAANHEHPDGTYDINAADLDNINIGDDVSEAGSINATEVNYSLQYWNGSSWINKYTVSGTGQTIDTDVDITNGGTYPDAAGYWRVIIDTNSASADFVQGIIKLKNAIDT